MQPTPSRPQGHWRQGYFDICNNNPHRLDHKGIGVKATTTYMFRGMFMFKSSIYKIDDNLALTRADI